MVFQDLALFPHMTVFENIAFGLRVKKVPKEEVRKRVRAAAAAVNIEALLDKLPRQCSGGESQRVALARTIVINPAVFLMDEPLSSLDAKLRVDMRTELKALHRRLKATFVYVTHDQAEAMTMADRIVVMSKGRIEQVGTPLDIYNRPASQFVAGFFGTPTMNFIEGTIEAAGDGRLFSSKVLDHSLTGCPDAGLCSGCGPSMSSWATAPRSRARCSSPSRSATPRSCISTAPPATGWSPRWGRARRCSPAAPSRSASTPAIATCSTQRTGRGFIEPASATGHADQRAPRGRCAGGGFPKGRR